MKKILIISSRSPQHSAGLGQSIMDCFESHGNQVDFLTLQGYENQPDNVISITNFSERISFKTKIKVLLRKYKLLSIIKNILKITKSILTKSPYITNNGITIKYPDESKPTVSSEEILRKIKKSYDAVITLFWQDMVNSSTIKQLYDVLQCPILIYSPDMSPMTGGCFYFSTCTNYTHECGNCPGFNSKDANDQSHKNYIIKKNNYENIKCAFLGNTWMNIHAKKSNLFHNIFKNEIIIDPQIFTLKDINQARAELGIKDNYKHIFLLRSDAHPRKGNLDIVIAFEKLTSKINNVKDLLIITIGDDYFSATAKHLQCDILNLGIVDIEKLILCYQSANFFISTSKDDAGPSMINQSIMCGTPVLCYNNGSALDVIENGVSGYKVNTGDVEGLSKLLLQSTQLDTNIYQTLRKKTRELAIIHNSPESIYKNFIEAINKLSI